MPDRVKDPTDLGHDQPATVERETPIRNATGRDDDPVMPQDDATLKTKI